MFLGQGLLLQPLLERALSLQSPASASAGHADTSNNPKALVDRVENFKAVLLNTSTNSSEQTQLDGDLQSQHKAKRRRIDDPFSLPSTDLRVANSENCDSEWTELPPNDLMDDLVEIYFANIHPWIPILHVRNFRQEMNDSMNRPRLKIIFHAIVSICVRFCTDSRLNDPELRARCAMRSRQTVILESMENFSVQNLQAMVIIAFDTVRPPRTSF